MRLIRTTALSLFLGACSVPVLAVAAQAQVVITVGVPPPPLPVYEQPPIPAPGYIWTPGYWAYDDYDGYYWVPGTWVEAPRPGLLWTPGYWGYEDGSYGYHDGYWGDHVGYYGGVDYGYGYGGDGYGGGYWRDNQFYYNRTVNNLAAVAIATVFTREIIVENRSRVSFNGGDGGLRARPTDQQMSFARAQHVQPTAMQREHVSMAQKDPALRESANQGKPPVAATSRPNDFKGAGVVKAKTAGERPQGQQIPRGKSDTNGNPGATDRMSPNAKGGHDLPVPGSKGTPEPSDTKATGGERTPRNDTAERPSRKDRMTTEPSDRTNKPDATEQTPKATRDHTPKADSGERAPKSDSMERTPKERTPKEHTPKVSEPKADRPTREAPTERAPRAEPRSAPMERTPRAEPRMQSEPRMQGNGGGAPRMPGGGGMPHAGGGEPHAPGGGGAPHGGGEPHGAGAGGPGRF